MDGAQLKVLVVDDDPSVVRLVSLIVANEGYLPVEASGGQEGLILLAEEPIPDIVILDLQMPDLDGRTFYRLARESGYDGPVIICSAYEAEQACHELGADAAIAKPFDPDELLASIKELAGVSR